VGNPEAQPVRIQRGAGAERMRHVRILLLWVVAAYPLVSYSHSALESSVPRAGALLSSAPEHLRLKFSEALEPALIKVQLSRNSAPEPMTLMPTLSADGKEIDANLGPLAPGTYLVNWNVVARDGHRTKGTFSFTVGGT
jgi:methionine-rich copper-binding protein CopC